MFYTMPFNLDLVTWWLLAISIQAKYTGSRQMLKCALRMSLESLFRSQHRIKVARKQERRLVVHKQV